MKQGTFGRFSAGPEKGDRPISVPDRGSTALLERQESKAKVPPLYQVLLLNDDFTPMEFVVVVLQKFFLMDLEKATQVMLKVHREGRGVCGVYAGRAAAHQPAGRGRLPGRTTTASRDPAGCRASMGAGHARAAHC